MYKLTVFAKELTIRELLLIRGIDPYELEDKLKLGGIKNPNQVAIKRILDLTFKDYSIYKVGVKEEKKEMNNTKTIIIAVCVNIFFSGFSNMFSDFDFSKRFTAVSGIALISIILLMFINSNSNYGSNNIKMVNIIDELLEIESNS